MKMIFDKCRMSKTVLISMGFYLLISSTLLGSTNKDWGDDEILNPSFSNDNRFNKPLDLTGDKNTTPDVPCWTQDLILYQLRIDKFGELPTINSAREKIHTLKELGITGVVLNPVAKAFKNFGGYEEWAYYSTVEPDQLDPDLGTEEDFANFVKELHEMGIKVFLDFEFHGVFDRDVFIKKMTDQAAYDVAGLGNRSSLLTTHPDFFNWIDVGTDNEHPEYTDWNTAKLIWAENGVHNEELKEWYKKVLVDDWIVKYDLDGLRLDLEPYEVASKVGYEYWVDVIDYAFEQTGKKIVLIPEDGNAERNFAFAFAQEDFGVDNPRVGELYGSEVKDFMITETIDIPTEYDEDGNVTKWGKYFEPLNIVDEVKRDFRNETFYTSCISSHDKHNYPSQGNLVYFGYGMLFQPFIPLWFMGNEFNVRETIPAGQEIIYFSRINWDDYENNMEHFNAVRKMIFIRKQYKNLIGPSTHELNKKPMVKISVNGSQPDMPSYGYFNETGDPVGIIVLGTKENDISNVSVTLPMNEMRLSGYEKYSLHNLMEDTEKIVSPKEGTTDTFILDDLDAWGNLIYKIEPIA